MMVNAPFISVCIPTYNRASMLPAAIESVLNQTYSNFELLILDNHSTDNTTAVIQLYRDPRIRVIRNKKTVGMYTNHNLCVQHAKADWVIFLHSDDKLYNQALATLAGYLSVNPDVTVFFPAKPMHILNLNTASMKLDGKSGIVSLMRWPTAAPTGTMYNRKWLYEIPFVDNNLAADLLFLDQTLYKSGSILIIPEPIVDIGEGSFQATNQWRITGKFIIDVAKIYNSMLSHPSVTEELSNKILEWRDDEIARVLMFLAHANKNDEIKHIEKVLSPRCGFKSSPHYRHVRLYKIAGSRGLKLMFFLAKLVSRSIKV